MEEQFDLVVIGAGIVGLAVARACALRGRQVLVLEKNRLPVQEVSARNSGVIHSGLYYPTGSLKARLCVRGKAMLYEYCRERQISHRQCGKLVVAQEQQVSALVALHAKARENAVEDARLVDEAEARQLEPEIRCSAAMLSPGTGIVDVHEYAMALVADLEGCGGILAYGVDVREVNPGPSGFAVEAESGGESVRISCASLVNAAGLSAVGLLRRIRQYPAQLQRKPYFAKGSYFALGGVQPFRHLVYPMPDEAGLGIHATIDMDGATRFGPNVEWIEAPEYHVDESRVEEFYRSVRTYWPGLPEGALKPDYAGVRPKLVGKGEVAADFVIEGADVHGLPRLVNLLGIESPGLTSSLAIADVVADMV